MRKDSDNISVSGPENFFGLFFIFKVKINAMKHVNVFFMVFLLFACQPPVSNRYSKLSTARWLLGTWQQPSVKGILTESWQQLNDSTFIGQSFFVSNGDTLSSESISLQQRKDTLFYIPTVADQNEGKPVVFTLTNLTDSSVTFENPKHDFPQKIEYQLNAPDSLIAEVSAVVEGKTKALTFRMERLKTPLQGYGN